MTDALRSMVESIIILAVVTYVAIGFVLREIVIMVGTALWSLSKLLYNFTVRGIRFIKPKTQTTKKDNTNKTRATDPQRDSQK